MADYPWVKRLNKIALKKGREIFVKMWIDIVKVPLHFPVSAISDNNNFMTKKPLEWWVGTIQGWPLSYSDKIKQWYP